jgi:hypothetical protein
LIRNRALLVRNPTLRDHFDKMALAVKAASAKQLGPQQLIKLASTIDQLDRSELKLVGGYSEVHQRPEDVIFKATFTKVAGELNERVATHSGQVYEKSAFRKLALTDVESLFGSEFVDRVREGAEIDPEKMAEEISAMPRPEAELLDALLQDNGIRPVLTKAASTRQGLSDEEMRAWAAAYQTV